MPFNKRVSVSYSSPALPYASPTGLQSQKFRGLSSKAGSPRLNSLMWGSDFSLLGKNLCNCHYPPILGLSTWVWVLIIFFLPPFSLWFLLHIFSLEIFSSSLQVVLIEEVSINSCNFGVPVRGCELRVCHLGLLLSSANLWETLSQDYLAKLLPNSWHTETMRW